MTAGRLRGIVVATMSLVSFAGAWMAAQQVRDVAGTPVVGTATVSGTVVTDDAQPRPVRRAVVTIGGDALGGSRDVVTDDRGAFAFSGLVGGRYSLSVTKGAWLTTYYGSRHPGRRPFGTSLLVVRDAEEVGPLTLRMVHGGVISGRILDPGGRPASASVTVLEARTVNGQRVLAPPTTRNGSSSTDDRGIYRLYGLPPGDYVVVAESLGDNFGFESGAIYQMTPEQWQAAQRPPAPGTNAVPATGDENRQGPAVAFAPIYYPGAADIAGASPVTIGSGEEKDDIDFVLRLVSTSRVSGSILAPDGRPPVGPVVTLQSKTEATAGTDAADLPETYITVRMERDGTFAANAVPPGEYTILARAQDPSAAPPPGGRVGVAGALRGGGPALFGTQDVSVAGHDVSGIAITLQPGLTIAGHIAADSSVTTSFDRWMVRALPAERSGQRGFPSQFATPDATGSFSLAGVGPGRYELMVVTAVLVAPVEQAAAPRRPALAVDTPGTPAVVESATVRGHDAIDLPFDVRPGDNIQDADVRLTARLGEISGVLRAAGGQSAMGYVIVVFSADRAYWLTTNRRMPMPVATDRDGAYRVPDLPAGEYLVAAASDLDPDSLHDADVLGALAAHATHVTLTSGEKKTLNFTIGAGG